MRESPLAHLEVRLNATRDHPAALRDVPHLAMVSVRVEPDSSAAERVGLTLGLSLPVQCGQTSSSQAHTAIWLGPDEWLVISERDEPSTLVAILERALADDRGSAIDVSANRTVLEISGRVARQVLAKGCPADLHPRVFTSGRAVSTRVGPVPLVLWQTGPESYRLLPRSSFADYLCRWLLDAATEYDTVAAPGMG